MATTTKNVTEIFNDLDSFREFCVSFGFVFRERELYDKRSYIYKSYLAHLSGKNVKSNWEIDAAKFKAKKLGM